MEGKIGIWKRGVVVGSWQCRKKVCHCPHHVHTRITDGEGENAHHHHSTGIQVGKKEKAGRQVVVGNNGKN